MIVFPHNRTLSICHTPIPAIMIPMYLWPLIGHFCFPPLLLPAICASHHLCFQPFVLPAFSASRREELTQTRLSSLAGVAASAMSNWLTRHYHISRPFGTFPFLQICHTPISPNLKFEFVTLPSPPSHIVHTRSSCRAGTRGSRYPQSSESINRFVLPHSPVSPICDEPISPICRIRAVCISVICLHFCSR